MGVRAAVILSAIFSTFLVDAKILKTNGNQLRADTNAVGGGAWFCSGETSSAKCRKHKTVITGQECQWYVRCPIKTLKDGREMIAKDTCAPDNDKKLDRLWGECKTAISETLRDLGYDKLRKFLSTSFDYGQVAQKKLCGNMFPAQTEECFRVVHTDSAKFNTMFKSCHEKCKAAIEKDMGTMEAKLRSMSVVPKKQRVQEYKNTQKVYSQGCAMGCKDLQGRNGPLVRPAKGREAIRACEAQIEAEVGKNSKAYTRDGQMLLRWCQTALTFQKAGCSSGRDETDAACRCAYSIRKNLRSMVQRTAYEHSCEEEFNMRLHPDGFKSAKACIKKELKYGAAGFEKMMQDWAAETCKPLVSRRSVEQDT